jgi:hemerythrin-like metal-binding protein
MDNKMVVQWQNSYSVGVRPIDEQHMELIRLTNKLFNSCMEGQEKGNSAFLEVIHEAVEYIGYHFGTEEKIMERINYLDFARHKKEHTDFVREVYTKVEDFESGKILAPLMFVYFLRDWVLHHIAVSDKRLGDYLLLMKRNGYLQRMSLRVRRDMTTNRMLIK